MPEQPTAESLVAALEATTYDSDEYWRVLFAINAGRIVPLAELRDVIDRMENRAREK